MDYIIPAVMCFVAVFGVFKKVNIFEAFIEGARGGIKTVCSVAPAMIGLLTAVGMLRASGAVDFLAGLIKPVTDFFGYPGELVPMALLRPFSGSGATALLTDIFSSAGPDSFLGRCAATLAGSTETTFYAVTMYYGSIGIKKIRHTLFAALAADLCAMIFCVITVSLFG